LFRLQRFCTTQWDPHTGIFKRSQTELITKHAPTCVTGRLCPQASITCTDYIKDLWVLPNYFFHHHTNHISSLWSRLLGFISMTTFCFLQPSDAWNTSTSTDGRTIEHIQQKFLSLCHLEYNYVNVINYFKFHSFKFRGVIKCVFFFYLMITVVQNLALHLWKHSVFMCEPRFYFV